jgi:hypothetical protein
VVVINAREAPASVDPSPDHLASIHVDHSLDWDIKIPDSGGDANGGNNHWIERVKDKVERMPRDFLLTPSVPAVFEFVAQSFAHHPANCNDKRCRVKKFYRMPI